MKSIVLTFVVATLALGSGGAWARDEAPPAARSVSVGGVARDYLLDTPVKASGPVPLVIALHGGGGNAKTMTPRWLETARREGFAVAFPSGVGRSSNMGTWNAGGCCGFAMASDSDDVAFIGAMIDDIARDHRIDPKRIYVTGLSNGGMLTYRIGEALAPRVAAIAVVSGAMFGGETPPTTPVPALIMHGEQDDIVPFKGGTSPMALVARSQTRPFREVAYAVDFWRRADGCADKPSVEPKGDVTVETYDQCARGGEVVFYRLKSAGHTWPGP
ncbi:PHB depolymerase family esterase, partial [Caulobacter segnis]